MQTHTCIRSHAHTHTHTHTHTHDTSFSKPSHVYNDGATVQSPEKWWLGNSGSAGGFRARGCEPPCLSSHIAAARRRWPLHGHTAIHEDRRTGSHRPRSSEEKFISFCRVLGVWVQSDQLNAHDGRSPWRTVPAGHICCSAWRGSE